MKRPVYEGGGVLEVLSHYETTMLQFGCRIILLAIGNNVISMKPHAERANDRIILTCPNVSFNQVLIEEHTKHMSLNKCLLINIIRLV